MGEQAIPELQIAAANGDLQSIDDLGEIGTASAASALLALVAEECDVSFRAAWWIAALIRRPEVEDGLRIARPTLPTSSTVVDWAWRPFAGETPVLSIPLGRVAWLLAHDVNDHCPASLPAIDHRLGIAAFISGFAYSDGSAPSAATRQSGEEEAGRRGAALYELRRATDESASSWDVAGGLYRLSLQDPALATSTMERILARLDVSQCQTRIFGRLSTGVKCQLLADDALLEWSRERSIVGLWIDSTADVREPKILRKCVVTIVCAVALAALAGAVYCAIGPWFGATAADVPWLRAATGMALVVLACGGVVLLVDEFVSAKHRGLLRFVLAAVDYLEDSDVALGVFLVSLLVGAMASMVVLVDLVGWRAAAVAAGGLFVATLVLSALVEQRMRRIRNPFRRYVARDASVSWQVPSTRLRPLEALEIRL
jgi:hypothetical protein